MGDKKIIFKELDQVAYIPRHAKGDVKHRAAQYGFVTSVTEKFVFCRFFFRSHVEPGRSLRTTGNSEPVYPDLLIHYEHMPQGQIGRCFDRLYGDKDGE